ncbi:hypothetical protein [Nocardiopsis sp. CNT-189]|uniref:hypothetical protein n=1 Tax=Nocardiopsis oceanisediminis TaxID=2816862 RepID=UPI003B3B79BF
MDDVDQTALENPSSSASPLGRFVPRKQLSRARVEAFPHEGSRAEHAVQPPITASV